MRIISTIIITSLLATMAGQAVAKSPAERARLKQSLSFEQKTTPTPYYTDGTTSGLSGEPTDDTIYKANPVIEEPQSQCGGRWFRPLANALGSVAGVVIGSSVGSGTGQQVGRIMGGAVGGVATNEAVKEVCE